MYIYIQGSLVTFTLLLFLSPLKTENKVFKENHTDKEINLIGVVDQDIKHI